MEKYNIYIYLKFSKRVGLQCSHQKESRRETLEVLFNLTVVMISQCIIYQIIIWYTLNVCYSICQLYLNKAEEPKKIHLLFCSFQPNSVLNDTFKLKMVYIFDIESYINQ